MEEKESDEDRVLRMVLAYPKIFKAGWPPRIYIWAWNRMSKQLGQRYIGSDVIDFYKKKDNKLEYFALLERLKLPKTSYELYL